MTPESVRMDFESYVRTKGLDMDLSRGNFNSDNTYYTVLTRVAFDAWIAAHSLYSPEQPDLETQNSAEMVYDPSGGNLPSDLNDRTVGRYRKLFPYKVWLQNPFTGVHRSNEEIQRDPFGYRIEKAVE